jgi:hypothetical protein
MNCESQSCEVLAKRRKELRLDLIHCWTFIRESCVQGSNMTIVLDLDFQVGGAAFWNLAYP